MSEIDHPSKPATRGDSMSDAGGNLSPESVRAFIDEYDDYQQELDDARASCKGPAKRIRELRKRVQDAGMSLRVFDRMREDMDLPATERNDDLRQYHQVMQYIGKPVTYQGGFVFEDPAGADVETAMATERQRARIADHGYTAGKAGKSNDINPWEQGTHAAVHWQDNWRRGYDEFSEEQARLAADMAPTAPKRGPGRPKGSGKAQAAAAASAPKGRRGKKAGAANAQADPAYEPKPNGAAHPEDQPLPLGTAEPEPAPGEKPADDDRF